MVDTSMSVPVFGLLCVMVMAVLFVATIVGSVVMIATLADKRVWQGVASAAKVAVPVMMIGFVMLLFFGISATTTVKQAATVEYHGPQQGFAHQEAMPPVVMPQGDLVSLTTTTSAPEVAMVANDLRPADALAVETTVPETVTVPSAKDLIPVKRPGWVPGKIEKTVERNGDATVVILPSALFATEQEAELSLEPQIQAIVSQDFLDVVRNRYVRPRQMAWVGNLAQSVVTDRYVETETRDLGAVTAPMYRVWKRLELSPQTRTQFFNTYRAQMMESRLMVASGLVLGLLAIPFAVLIGAKGARMTNGRGKSFWKASAVAFVLLIWGAGIAWINHCVVLL